MLRYLRVRDLAVFKEAACGLGPGLNLITGETGAGKSLLVDAIGLLVGERASLDDVRTGEAVARVEGVFEVNSEARRRLEALGYDASSGELVVRRELRSGDRSRAFLNDSPATVEALREVGEALVEIHGQHAHQALLRPEVHRDWLDEAAGLGEVRAEVARLHGRLVQAEMRLSAAIEGAGERARRIETLQETIREIESASPVAGEAEELRAESGLLRNRERLAALASEALFLLSEDDDGSAARRAGRVGEAIREIQEIAGAGALSEARAQAEEACVLLGESARSLASFQESLDADPGRLDALELRLALLERLERRHGGSLDAVLRRLEEARREMEELAGPAEEEGTLRREAEEARRAWTEAAGRLRAGRLEARERLARRVEAELAALAMGKARFVITVDPAAPRGPGVRLGEDDVEPAPHGGDRVEFLISTNPGEEPRPLRKTASGGEMSRIMLALRTALPGDRSDAPTLVFDEVDAGVAGRTAAAVGERLAAVSTRHQVLCVTHLPQVAARADRHLSVTKREKGGRTLVEVRTVEREERIAEVARMLGGTPAAEEHARRLVAPAAGDRPRRRRRREAAS